MIVEVAKVVVVCVNQVETGVGVGRVTVGNIEVESLQGWYSTICQRHSRWSSRRMDSVHLSKNDIRRKIEGTGVLWLGGSCRETYALRGVVITTENRLNGTGLAGAGRRVSVSVVIASSGILTIVAVPSEDWMVFIIVILLAEIVTLIVEFEVESMFKKAREATDERQTMPRPSEVGRSRHS